LAQLKWNEIGTQIIPASGLLLDRRKGGDKVRDNAPSNITQKWNSCDNKSGLSPQVSNLRDALAAAAINLSAFTSKAPIHRRTLLLHALQ
jgi:hypothetical protein